MDPLTQGVFGALAAQASSSKHLMAKASVIGAAAGMAPDLDVLIRSSSDPLLFLEFHRHFTHSLFFIPIGALICAGIFYLILAKRWQLSFKQIYLWCFLGYATHGLLDSCTSYGTHLLWPISDVRTAWDLVSVIDPLLSAVLLALVASAIYWRKHGLTVAAVLWIGLYLSVAGIQHHRALIWGQELAESRGHSIQRLHAKPSFGNIVVWKTIYESDGYFYVDAFKPGLSESHSWYGSRIKKLNLEQDLSWMDSQSLLATDVERFRHFSDGFIAFDPSNPMRIGDVRYSQLPHHIKPLWAIELPNNHNDSFHAVYVTQRSGSQEALPELLNMIFK